MMLAAVSSLVLLFTAAVRANVEKTIFLAPEAMRMPNDASINHLLVPLTPERPTARTFLNATFPTDTDPKGTQTWVLLDGLTPATRYEVRVCWITTQPTEFSLHTHTIAEAFENSELLSALTLFSDARRATINDIELQRLTERTFRPTSSSMYHSSSSLFLQIFAAADYFSLNQTLMNTVPPVFVDIILDPYIWNVIPKSLLPTAGYISILAVASWFLSEHIWRRLSQAVRQDEAPISRSRQGQNEKKNE